MNSCSLSLEDVYSLLEQCNLLMFLCVDPSLARGGKGIHLPFFDGTELGIKAGSCTVTARNLR